MGQEMLPTGWKVDRVTMAARQIHQVVTELLENTVRFSPPGGQVVVRVTHCTDQVCLTMTDQGPGIAPEALAWMFKAFIPQDIAHHTSGHGLSLAIAQQIVLAHNGTMQVGSTPGVETTFTVRLPEAVDAESGWRIE